MITILGAILRLRFITMCDVGDRGQHVLGMTNNLPPLYHYVTWPFLKVTGDLWYSPAFANIALSLLSIVILYFLGKLVKDRMLGLTFAFVYAVLPASLLVARHISPESPELFFMILIAYLFLRLEVFQKKDNYYLWLGFYFLSLAIGAFSKQQTITILFPIFLYGLYKHRLGIFRNEFYYISGLTIIPFIAFLAAHPETLSAMHIYFIQPGQTLSLLQKIGGLLGIYLLFYLVQSVVLIGFVARIKQIWKEYDKQFTGFAILVFVFYNLFIIKTDRYFHLLAMPVVLLSGLFVNSLKTRLAKAVWLVLLFLYCFLGFFLIVPGFSIVTQDMCEFDALGLAPTYFMKLTGTSFPKNRHLYHTNNFFEDILKDEKYVLVGGNTGQDIKYNIRRRLYYAGVINTERFKEINYAILLYPLDTAYTGAPAWDYPYLKQVVENSDIIIQEPYGQTYEFVMLRINNHSIDTSNISGYRIRSREGLRYDEWKPGE